MSDALISQRLPRRDLIRSFGAAAAGLAFLDQSIAQENKPGAQVDDRASSIRITGMKTYWVGPVVYLKLETNHGIVGWGDIKGVDPRVAQRPGAVAVRTDRRREPDADRISLAERSTAPIATSAAGRFWSTRWRRSTSPCGTSPANCGTCRSIGCWAGRRGTRFASITRDKALKVPPHGIYEHSGNPADIERMVNAIKAAREKVGPDGAVMFDAHSRRAAGHADPTRRGHQAVRRAVHRGAGRAGEHRGLQAAQGADRHSAGDRRTRPHDLGSDPVSARALHRHPAARLLPHRRHHVA